MKKEFVTLKKALPGFVAECIKVVNRENPLLGDIHVDDNRSLNYYLKRFLVGREIWEDKDIFLLNLVYIKINMIWSGEYEIGNCVRVNYRKKVQNPEGDRRICADEVANGIILYIYEMIDEDNFNLFRLTSGAWHEEYQSNDIYRGLKNDKELADLANRKVWRLWTGENDDKEVEDVEKEEAGKEITGEESDSQKAIIKKYFTKYPTTLPKDKIKEAVEYCGKKSKLAFLKLVFERKKYTSCISNHKLFINTLRAMELINKEDEPYSSMKGKYYQLTDKDYKWSEEDSIIYDALMEIFKEESFD